MIKHLLFVFAILITLFSCQDQQRKEQLDQREKSLAARERLFATKEKDYQSLLHMRDSMLAQRDTDSIAPIWPDSLLGQWKSKVICRASNCNDYVVGDQRTDNWAFINDSTGMLAQMQADKTHIRTFTGSLSNGQVHLHYLTDSAAQRQVDMMLALYPSKTDFLQGTQVIKVNNNCTATFDIELVRLPNN